MSVSISFISDDQFSDFRRFLLSLSKSSQAKVARVLDALEQHGHLLSMPYSKKIESEIWELRILGKHHYRIFYTMSNSRAFILHWFLKKTNKTPRRELEIARKNLTII